MTRGWTASSAEYVETIRGSGEALLGIINDILDFSKIEAERLELETRPLELRGASKARSTLVTARANEKGLNLVSEMEPAVPAGIDGDLTRLRQILVNLFSNAVKFTESGEVALSVDLIEPEAAPRGDVAPMLLRFSVRDTGPGIPPDRMDRLFQSFSQVDASTTRRYGGTGLGLAISRRLSQLMGGDMWAESEGEGRGSIFRFTIRGRPAPVPERAYLTHVQPDLAGRRLLIVDDHATNRRVLSLQAASWGMHPTEAASAGEALALAASDVFDVAILDMQNAGRRRARAGEANPTGREGSRANAGGAHVPDYADLVGRPRPTTRRRRLRCLPHKADPRLAALRYADNGDRRKPAARTRT